MNISSIVVRTSPEHMEEVIEGLRTSGLCDVYFHDERGRIIVTIEGENLDGEIKKVRAIQTMAHVLSAELTFSYSEEELLNAREHSENIKDSVPDALKDDTIDARDIPYGGNLK